MTVHPPVHPYWQPGGPPPALPTSGMAVGSIVLGGLGLIGVCCWPLLILSLAGILLGHVALGEVRKGLKSGRGLALAGLMVSYFSLLPAVVVLIMSVAGVGIDGLDGGTR